MHLCKKSLAKSFLNRMTHNFFTHSFTRVRIKKRNADQTYARNAGQRRIVKSEKYLRTRQEKLQFSS